MQVRTQGPGGHIKCLGFAKRRAYPAIYAPNLVVKKLRELKNFSGSQGPPRGHLKRPAP